MEVKMSERFGDAAKEAAMTLSDENSRIYLRKPFSGFYVTYDVSEECLDSFESDSGRRIFVFCESFLGRRASGV